MIIIEMLRKLLQNAQVVQLRIHIVEVWFGREVLNQKR